MDARRSRRKRSRSRHAGPERLSTHNPRPSVIHLHSYPRAFDTSTRSMRARWHALRARHFGLHRATHAASNARRVMAQLICMGNMCLSPLMRSSAYRCMLGLRRVMTIKSCTQYLALVSNVLHMNTHLLQALLGSLHSSPQELHVHLPH